MLTCNINILTPGIDQVYRALCSPIGATSTYEFDHSKAYTILRRFVCEMRRRVPHFD